MKLSYHVSPLSNMETLPIGVKICIVLLTLLHSQESPSLMISSLVKLVQSTKIIPLNAWNKKLFHSSPKISKNADSFGTPKSPN